MQRVIDYKSLRMSIRDGDVLTFAGSWLTSRLIRWWTRQSVSHVGFACWLKYGKDSRDRLCIVESMEPGGCRMLPMSYVLPLYWASGTEVFWQQTLVNGTEALGWAIEQWGLPYASWFQFLTIMSPGIRRVRKRLGFPMKVGTGRYHCSELVTRALMVAGYEHGIDPSLTTPGDVQGFACLSEPVRVTA